jgi:hypothetical protein
MRVLLQMIMHFLSEHMRELPMPHLEEVCQSMQLVQYEQHSVVYSKGDESMYFYLVLAGTHAHFCDEHSCHQHCCHALHLSPSQALEHMHTSQVAISNYTCPSQLQAQSE